MRQFIDQLNRTIQLSDEALKIISLVPSQTELLFDLGLEDEVVGITKFCVHPEKWYRTKVRVGGTKTVNIDKVRSLNPNLIIANKEENTQADIQALEKIAPVWISDVRDLESAYQMIEKIGELVGKVEIATALIQKIRDSFDRLYKLYPPSKVLYVIWDKPVMVAARDTFIHSILEHLGMQNAAEHLERYPELTIAEIKSLKPDLIFLSSEPYPFKEKHVRGFEKQFSESKIVLVDGEMFSWYGSRLVRSGGYFEDSNSKISLSR